MNKKNDKKSACVFWLCQGEPSGPYKVFSDPLYMRGLWGEKSAIHVREVAPDSITITREEFKSAIEEHDLDEWGFDTKGLEVTLFGDYREIDSERISIDGKDKE